jgi:hypothetical protein
MTSPKEKIQEIPPASTIRGRRPSAHPATLPEPPKESPMTLRGSLDLLTTTFVDALLEALRAAPLGELLLEEGRTRFAGGQLDVVSAYPKMAVNAAYGKVHRQSVRLKRRTSEEIRRTVTAVLGLLHKHPDGMRSEQIRDQLGLDIREMPRVLHAGIDNQLLKVLSGHKRSTVYGLKVATQSKPKTKAKAKSPKKTTFRSKPKAKAKTPKKTPKKTAVRSKPKAKAKAKGRSPKKAVARSKPKAKARSPKKAASAAPAASTPPPAVAAAE